MTAKKTISKIVITGDFLRPAVGLTVSSQVGNINWLGTLIGYPIKKATGHDIEFCTWDDNSVTGLTTRCIEGIYEEFQEPLDIAGWAKIYSKCDFNNRLNDVVEQKFKNALVIGFEIPPVIQNVLDHKEVPYISIAIHPIRYLDDIIFGFKSNISNIRSALDLCRVKDDLFYKMAGIQAAAALRTSHFTPQKDSILLIGQTQFDASCIKNKRFVSLLDYKQDLTSLFAGKSKIYFKPHPFQAGTELQERLNLELGLPVDIVKENIYYLLSQRNISDVVMLSSSVGVEAKYFGKRATYLIEGANKQWLSSEDDGTDEYVPVDQHCLDADFWRQALNGLTEVTKIDGERLSPKPNRLRISLGQFWSYNEIDSDVMIGLAMRQGTEAHARTERIFGQLLAETSIVPTGKERNLFEKLLLKRNGRPINPVRRLFFHTNGMPRRVFRYIVLNSAGLPRSFFRHWMSSYDYYHLPKAIKTSRSEYVMGSRKR